MWQSYITSFVHVSKWQRTWETIENRFSRSNYNRVAQPRPNAMPRSSRSRSRSRSRSSWRSHSRYFYGLLLIYIKHILPALPRVRLPTCTLACDSTIQRRDSTSPTCEKVPETQVLRRSPARGTCTAWSCCAPGRRLSDEDTSRVHNAVAHVHAQLWIVSTACGCGCGCVAALRRPSHCPLFERLTVCMAVALVLLCIQNNFRQLLCSSKFFKMQKYLFQTVHLHVDVWVTHTAILMFAPTDLRGSWSGCLDLFLMFAHVRIFHAQDAALWTLELHALLVLGGLF